MRKSLAAAAVLWSGCVGLSGCVVAGYSSGGGLFVWPGSIVISLIALLVFYLLRRGR